MPHVTAEPGRLIDKLSDLRATLTEVEDLVRDSRDYAWDGDLDPAIAKADKALEKLSAALKEIG